MNISKIIHVILKGLIAFISITMLVTALIGGVSIFNILGTSDNISVDTDYLSMSFGYEGNNFEIPMQINNTGYFDFQNFMIHANVFFNNKTSAENFTILDKTLFQQDLNAKQFYSFNITAIEADFNTAILLVDNNNSWFDPDVQPYIDNGTATEAQVAPLSYPYLLDRYDVYYTLSISSKYNLGLIDFNLKIEFKMTYADLGLADYETMKMNLLGGL
ncbi:MAG: hypothetical protein ACTSVL_05070 [Promethearchaeota archaeon]